MMDCRELVAMAVDWAGQVIGSSFFRIYTTSSAVHSVLVYGVSIWWEERIRMALFRGVHRSRCKYLRGLRPHKHCSTAPSKIYKQDYAHPTVRFRTPTEKLKKDGQKSKL